MNKQDFEKYIAKNNYQILLLTCPISFPLNFITHSWIVLIKKKKVIRLEVQKFKNYKNKNLGYIHLNLIKPWEGFRVFFIGTKPNFKGKLVGYLKGDENSNIKKIIENIEKKYQDYPLKDKYKYYSGPNSNSFTQWIISEFCEDKLKLPKSALGKNYKK